MLNQFQNIFSSPLSKQEDLSARHQESENSLGAETVETLIQEGDKLYHQGELEQALSYYHQAVEREPNSAQAHEKLARVWQKRGDFPQAMIHYRKAIALNNAQENLVPEKKSAEIPGSNLQQDRPQSTTMSESNLVNLSSPLLKQQHSPAQRESTTQSTVLVNKSETANSKREAAEIYLQQALAYSDEQEWSEVTEACQRAVEISPDLAEAYKLWGNALQRMGQTSKAMGMYAKAVEIEPDLAEVYANVGSLYARKQKWPQAREYYQKAIIIKPNFPGAYRNLAKVWKQLGEPEKAAECQNQALSLESQGVNPEAYLISGDLLIGANKPERAIEYYLKAIKLAPDSRLGYQKVAETWEKLGKWQEAATYYRHLLKLEPEPSSQPPQLTSNGKKPALPSQQSLRPKLPVSRKTEQLLQANPDVPSKQKTVMGNKSDRISKLDLEIAKYEQQVQQVTDSAPLQANLGSLYAQKQEWRKALICYQKAIKLNPNLAGVYRNLAKVWGKLGKEMEAAKCYYQALSLEPQSANAEQYYHLGNILDKQNQSEEAIVCYRRAIELKPYYAQAHFRLGEILQSRGHTTEAIACWEQAIRFNKTNPNYYYHLGQLLVQAKNFERAIFCYRQAIKLQPKRWEISHQLGEILSQVERWQEAVVAYNQALAINKQNPELYLGLGNALAKTAELDKAIVAYQIALQIEPGDREALVQLANILRQKELDREEISLAQQIDYPETVIERQLPEPDVGQQQNEQKTADVRLIAFFLPQYHPIPENDEWWGKGFTEWTNVTRAKPSFEGHYQPHLPADLGFYDLRLPEIREAQANLAKHYGIYGFCYYYYWFNGRRLLERPLDAVLRSKKPDFPFCICWANENWTRRWDGEETHILVAQEYTPESLREFAESVIPYLQDERYIRIDGQPLLLIYRIGHIPTPTQAIQTWREVFRQRGVGEVHIAGVLGFGLKDPVALGCNSAVQFPPNSLRPKKVVPPGLEKANFPGYIFDYSHAVGESLRDKTLDERVFPSVMPSWDNTARRKEQATVWLNASPERYKLWLRGTIEKVRKRNNRDERIVFINSWNEWAEGAHLEPDQKYGHRYLEATQEALLRQCDWQTILKLLQYYPLENAEQLEQLLDEFYRSILIERPSIETFSNFIEEDITCIESIDNVKYAETAKDKLEIIHHLESPTVGIRLDDSCQIKVSGWLLSKPHAPVAIELIANNKLIKQIPINISRSDVSEAFPNFKCKYNAFSGQISLDREELLGSSHTVNAHLQVILKDSSTALVANFKIKHEKVNRLEKLKSFPGLTANSARILADLDEWIASKPRLFILHDIASAGAQLFLVRLLEWICHNRPTMNVEILINIPREQIEDYGEQGKFILDRLQNCGKVHFIDGQTNLPENVTAIRQSNYSLIYVNTCTLGNLLESIGNINVPVMVHVHELTFWIKYKLGLENFNRLLKYEPHIIACSNAVRDNLINICNVSPQQIEVIHAFIPTERLIQNKTKTRAQMRDELNIDRDVFVLAGCGTLDWRKGADLLIPLVVLLKEKLSVDDFVCVWIGGWQTEVSESEMRFTVEKAGLEKNIILTGYKTNVIDYLGAADAFLLLSREDPFPLVMSEAGICKLPVIGFDGSGGVTEFVESEAGVTVPYLNLNAMAEEIVRLYHAPDLVKKMGENAYRKVHELYSEDILAPKIVDSIERMSQGVTSNK